MIYERWYVQYVDGDDYVDGMMMIVLIVICQTVFRFIYNAFLQTYHKMKHF